MMSTRLLISTTTAITLLLAAPGMAQTPPIAPPAPPAFDKLQLDLDLDLADLHARLSDELSREWASEMKNLAKEITRSFAEMQDPPRPPRPPRAPQQRDDRAEVSEPFARNFKVGAGAALLVSNVSGDIRVTAGGAGEIDVKATKRARSGSDAESKRRLANTQIEVSATGNRVELRVESTPRTEGTGQVEFEITVPSDCTLDLHSISGDIFVTNVKGELRANAVSGDIRLDGTSRIASVKTISGDIDISGGGGDAAMTISTISGDLTATTLTARSLDINSVSGDSRISGFAGERVSARSLSGEFDLGGSLAKGGRYDVESHSGDIRLMLADQPGFEIDANTFSGQIRIDFAVTVEGPVRDRNRGPRSVRGTYGDRSATVRVQTFSGEISVVRR
ncbi:MAG: DUF4097 domain-containing protein [Vicinamibacterales bacterium]|nr:DUF4097 domain-containing protein [Vicinamibacterales bacterium]